ncbi:MAG: response regulator [Actinobacteria bacterium]|nr:response regulator [Actinomycetota bacterium]
MVASSRQPPESLASVGRTRVVVAEDEALIRLDLVEMLTELGYQVVGEATNGQQAVELTRTLEPDLVFMDVAMPVRDGLSAAEEIVVERLAPVVLVTAFSQQDTVSRAAEAGVMGYLVKPFSRSDLAPAAEMALARWAQLSGLTDRVDDLGARLAARSAVDEAKSLIQQHRGVSESEAFAELRRQAMDNRVTLAEMAARLLAHGQEMPG